MNFSVVILVCAVIILAGMEAVEGKKKHKKLAKKSKAVCHKSKLSKSTTVEYCSSDNSLGPKPAILDSIEHELKKNKFYVRGETNLNNTDKWGPARDVSYFLYDREPFEELAPIKRMRRVIPAKSSRSVESCETKEANTDEGDGDGGGGSEEPLYGDYYVDPEDTYLEKTSNTEPSLAEKAANMNYRPRKLSLKSSHDSRYMDTKMNPTGEMSELNICKEGRIRTNPKSVGRYESVWGPWSKWGPCSATCGFGTRARYRVCLGGRCVKNTKVSQFMRCFLRKC